MQQQFFHWYVTLLQTGRDCSWRDVWGYAVWKKGRGLVWSCNSRNFVRAKNSHSFSWLFLEHFSGKEWLNNATPELSRSKLAIVERMVLDKNVKCSYSQNYHHLVRDYASTFFWQVMCKLFLDNNVCSVCFFWCTILQRQCMRQVRSKAEAHITVCFICYAMLSHCKRWKFVDHFLTTNLHHFL